jgi:hypothetical protein
MGRKRAVFRRFSSQYAAGSRAPWHILHAVAGVHGVEFLGGVACQEQCSWHLLLLASGGRLRSGSNPIGSIALAFLGPTGPSSLCGHSVRILGLIDKLPKTVTGPQDGHGQVSDPGVAVQLKEVHVAAQAGERFADEPGSPRSGRRDRESGAVLSWPLHDPLTSVRPLRHADAFRRIV